MPARRPEEFTKLASGMYLEGLAIDHARQIIWYSDVIGGGIHGITPEGALVVTFNAERMWTGGVMMNADGAVLSSGQGGIMWNHPESGQSGWLLDAIDGAPINGINEMAADSMGGIFFGTVDLDSVIKAEQPGSTAIYRLSATRELTKLAEGIGFSNGMMFDPARRRFYCNDTFTCTWAFDVGSDFALTNKQEFLAKDDADGMALDAEGNVWITGFRSSFFARVTPDAVLLPPVPSIAGAITQLRFGGADGRDLYFNAVPIDGGDSLKDGVPLTEKRSFLYRGRADVVGLAIEPARFQLGYLT